LSEQRLILTRAAFLVKGVTAFFSEEEKRWIEIGAEGL
jgi:hypothetical protein